MVLYYKKQYDKYLEDKTWQCIEGKSHFWILGNGGVAHCKYCNNIRDFAKELDHNNKEFYNNRQIRINKTKNKHKTIDK